MVAGDLDHRSRRGGRWDPEAVARSLDDEDRDSNLFELDESARRGRALRPAWWLEREREAQDADCRGRLRGAACDPGARGATSDDDRQFRELTRTQVVDEGDPRGVELVCGRRRAASRDPIRLLDEHDAHILGAGPVGRRDEVPSCHASARTVPEHEGCAGRLDGMEVRTGRAVRRVDLG